MELPVQQFRTKGEQAYLDMFEAARDGLPGARDSFVAGLRNKAIEAYGRLGLPHRRIEAWKYTDLRALLGDVNPLIRATGLPLDAGDVKRALGAALAALPAFRLFMVEGELRADFSDLAGLKSAGVEVVSLAEALEKPASWLKQALGAVNPREDDSVVALNAALMTGGVALRVGEGVALDKPIHLIHLDGTGEPASIFTRALVLAEPGSALTLIESFAGLGLRGLQRNAVTELRIGAKAAIDHIKIEREADDAVHLGTALVEIGADARYNAFQFSTGAALIRSQTFARFTGEGSVLDISGALLMRGRQHCDTTLLVEHAVPHCTSRELFKAVLDGEARGIFQGKIIVAPDAQKTDGKQMAQALLLSETAEFDSKPELEIFADDVVCGHGSTSGQIDEDLLFYLEARGIPEDEARALLIQAFIGEALERIEHEDLREALIASSAEWLGASAEQASGR
jgi:Fe-S cluster assembly protein SufD